MIGKASYHVFLRLVDYLRNKQNNFYLETVKPLTTIHKNFQNSLCDLLRFGKKKVK